MTQEPAFRTSEIRLMMDVYSFDAQYLGSVLWIRAETEIASAPALDPSMRQSSVISGEAIGPAPTQEMGNPGPVTQSPLYHFGNRTRGGSVFGEGRMLVGKYYGLGGMQWIPLSDIQTVAMERVVLRNTADYYA